MTGSLPRVKVEFYGLARLRAGRVEFWTQACTLGAVLAAADVACVNLHAMRDNALSPEYLVSLGGRRFTRDVNEPLEEGTAILLLGADAGG